MPGAVTATLGTGSLTYPSPTATPTAGPIPGTLAFFAAAVVLLLAFLVIEHASRAPMLPPRVIADRRIGRGAR